MREVAIDIRGISKEYRLADGQNFQALQNIDLEIYRGEVMGLIGPNGAGKSTLLKILSRITYPDRGEISIRGRLASLLEVGTGFHPELSGRENIFLNGSILGMSKEEIKARFEEIVEFSGVGKFLDSPVKHYSSGMYVRLAFSVAAHLHSDILLIDEVLAVGDAEFQQKCLRKMNEASREDARTVIFVSHNMSIARSFCHRIAYLEEGRIEKLGAAEEVSAHYLKRLKNLSSESPLSHRRDRLGNAEAQISEIRILQGRDGHHNVLISGERAEIGVSYQIKPELLNSKLNFQLHIFNEDGNYLCTLSNEFTGTLLVAGAAEGSYRCVLERLPLMPGRYYFNIQLFVNGRRADAVNHAAEFEVLRGDYYGSGNFYERRVAGLFIDQQWGPQSLER